MSMKTKSLLQNLFILLAAAFIAGCEKESATSPEPAPEPAPDCVVDLQLGVVTETTATFTITSENAAEVKYIVKSADAGTPTAEEWESTGVAVEANTEQTVTINDLVAETDYIVAAIATGEGLSAEKQLSFTTVASPVLSVALSESIGFNFAVFTVEAANVAEVKYVCIEAGSRDVTAEQVLKNGVAVEAEIVTVDGLEESTDYEIYVAAQGVAGTLVMADALSFTTLRQIREYVMSNDTTGSSYMYDSSNYYITFSDPINGYILKGDFYCDDSNPYLPSGLYTLGGMNVGEASQKYTTFMFTPEDDAATAFAEGYFNVTAEPNEQTREVYYTIFAMLYFENGDSVKLDYSGIIAGIKLPEVEEPESDSITFVVDPATSLPRRYHGSSIVDGEYYIKFYDSNWNELTLDIYLDPTFCKNGAAALPTGIYSTADGLINTSYSSIVLYNPYFSATFTEAELEVIGNGDTFTFKLKGVVSTGSESKSVTMEYTGEVTDMTL